MKKFIIILIIVVLVGIISGAVASYFKVKPSVEPTLSKNVVEVTAKPSTPQPTDIEPEETEEPQPIPTELKNQNKITNNKSNTSKALETKSVDVPVVTSAPVATSAPTKIPETEESVQQTETVSQQISQGTLIGSDFTLYHYAPTGNPTASGRMPVVGVTVAVDPSYIRLGSWLRIEIPSGSGYTVYRAKARADDTGGNIKGHKIDIFVGSNSEAINLGVIRNARVYLLED